MSQRRTFLREAGLAAAAMLTAHPVLFGRETGEERVSRLTILHTNDVHSRLDPFPMDGSANAGRGGVAARAALIRKIRKEEEQVLLLDAGDIFQGTPYFNIFKGEPELRAMQMMGYEAAVMGNHDFDLGIGNFAEQMKQHAAFPIVMCNYDFQGTAMEGRSIPHLVLRKGNLRIGITGVGIELDGLVPENLYGKTIYQDPVARASEQADYLKNRKKCDMVICLSHLGDKYTEQKVSDEVLAQESAHIDLIIGGHTHRFFDAPRTYRNRIGQEVLVNQMGWAGLRLGRLDYTFEGTKGKKLVNNQSLSIGKKTAE